MQRYAAAIPGGPVLGPVDAADVDKALTQAQERWPELKLDLGVAPPPAAENLLQGTLFAATSACAFCGRSIPGDRRFCNHECEFGAALMADPEEEDPEPEE